MEKYPASHQEDSTSAEKTEQGASDVTPDFSGTKEERRLVLKQDLIILPLMALSLFFGYLDRGNIGNARVLGMQADLGFTSQQFYNCIMMFYVGYMVVELPAGLAMRYFHPRYVFCGALLVFGICATCMAASKSYAGIMVLRVIIGLGEAFANNAYLYTSLWYKPSELGLRIGFIYCMTPIAGAISGVIAYGVGKGLSHSSGRASWEWLFIIEGVITLAFGLLVVFLLPGLPEVVAEKGSWIFKHQNERNLILQRYEASQNSKHAKFRPHQIRLAITDPKLWLGSLMVGAQGVGIGAFSVFLPTFVQQFGFSDLETQLYSMIPYAFGLATLISLSYLADKYQRKGLLTAICLGITSTGFVILLATTNKVALMAGASFVAAGAYPGLAISVAWLLAFHGGFTKRATAIWFVQIFVQSYSIIASQVYRTPPRFFLGHGIALAFYVIAALSTLGLIVIVSRANKAKAARASDYAARGEIDPDMDEDYERLCDFHPGYIYVL